MPAEITIGAAGETIIVGAVGETIILDSPVVVRTQAAAGADGSVQFNDAGVLGGAAGLSWDKATEELLINGGAKVVSPADGELDITNAAGTEGALVRLNDIQFDLVTAAATPAEGKLQWDAENKTLSLGMPGGNVNLQIGQEFMLRCRNTSGAAMANGTVVYVTGVTGNAPNISPADNSTLAAASFFGVTTEAIDDSDFGFVTTSGVVNGVDTSGLTAGQLLWLNGVGAWSTTRPAAPAFSMVVGAVLRVDASVGSIYVRPVYIPRLTSLSDCNIRETVMTDGDLVSWDLASLRFDRVTRASLIGGGTGAAGLVAFFTGPGALAGDVGLSFDQATGLLQFGGVTSSFPAWKRNGNDIEARLADDSALTDISALNWLGSGSVRNGATGKFRWSTRSEMTSPADGQILLTNDAAADFSRLMFGGTTAAFPSWRRTGTAIHARLADDSGFTKVLASIFDASTRVQVAEGANYRWIGRSQMYSPSDGQVLFTDAAGTDFARLMFGGTTSAYPSIKRNGALLQVRLADDSANASFQCGPFTSSGSITVGASSVLRWGTSRSKLFSDVDGNIRTNNAAEDDFGLLQFGGVTSAFPALKRSAAGLLVQLADDSGLADIGARKFNAEQSITLGSAWGVIFGSRSVITSPVNGNVRLTNGAGSDFGRLQFGGETSAFPSWKRDGVNLRARLADDSADTGIIAATVETAKTKDTLEGGRAVRLTNKTGANSIKGTCVEASATTDDAFDVSAVDALDPIGFVYEDGVADGSECWVVIEGIAEALIEDGTAATRHYWAGTSSTAGRITINTAVPPGAVLAHFQEVGHGIQSVASGTDVLARILVHKN